MAMQSNIATLKQPAPKVISGEEKPQEKREIKVPAVGVVDVPNISKTPMADTLALKQQENPHTVYKLTSKKKPNLNFSNVSTVGIIGFGLAALISIIKGIRGKK